MNEWMNEWVHFLMRSVWISGLTLALTVTSSCFVHHLLSMRSCIKTKPWSCFQMCRRVRYWNKCRQQAVLRLTWRQRAQEVFHRLFTVNLCPSFLVPQPRQPSWPFWLDTLWSFCPTASTWSLSSAWLSFSSSRPMNGTSAESCCLHWNTKIPQSTRICSLKYFSASHVRLWLLIPAPLM